MRSINTLSEIVDISRDDYYKWLYQKSSTYKKEQTELLEAILKLGEKHRWTLGYLGMTK